MSTKTKILFVLTFVFALLSLSFSALSQTTVKTNYTVTIGEVVTITNTVWKTNLVSLTPDQPAANLFGGPLTNLWDFLTTSSNIMVTPFGMIQDDGKKFGGGLGLSYVISTYVASGIRLEYWDGQVWLPSLNIQLQAPVILAGKLTVIPFAYTAIGLPLTGSSPNNGEVMGILGAGAALRLDFLSKSGFISKCDLITAYEHRTNLDHGVILLGAGYKF